MSKHVFVAPGNPGISSEKNVTNIKINVDNKAEVCFCLNARIIKLLHVEACTLNGILTSSPECRWSPSARRKALAWLLSGLKCPSSMA
jgi:hypothetical protein